MEPPVVRSRGRPRKRRRNDPQVAADEKKAGIALKRQDVGMRPMALVGRFVLKEFKGNGVYLGKVMYYGDGLYRVIYEDGDSEDLESGEIRLLLIDEPYFDDVLTRRRKRLIDLADKLCIKGTNGSKNIVSNSAKEAESSSISMVASARRIENDSEEADVDADSSSDSCEYAQDRNCEPSSEILLIPPPKLPPSSGTIGVPEEFVSHLFSVYGFCRSFSIQLFLFPFSLDDFVGSLNCRVQNTLLDAIHVALMGVLRRQLETASSEGLESASKCLRCMDWDLLDALTWPVFLVRYLTVMGYVKGWEWNDFYGEVMEKEYYSVSVGRKLMILQILCDTVVESSELRVEIDTREELEGGLDNDADAVNISDNGPRRVHPRYSKTSACKDGEAMEIIGEKRDMKSSNDSTISGLIGTNGFNESTNADGNRNSDECRLCGMDGILLCCDGCPSAYHSRCIGVMKMFIPEGLWYCPECIIIKIGPNITTGTSLRGAEIFGIDSYEQVFLASCNHLLVIKASINTEPGLRYYIPNDIPMVLQLLCSSAQHASLYSCLCKSIMSCWDIPESSLSLPESNGLDLRPAYVAKESTLLTPIGGKDHKVVDITEDDKIMSGVCERTIDSVEGSWATTSSSLTATKLPEHQNKNSTAPVACVANHTLSESVIVDYAASNSSVSQLTDPSDLTQQVLVDRCNRLDLCNSGSSNANCDGHGNNTSFPAPSKEGRLLGQGKSGINSIDHSTYIGSTFKSHAYINHYMHGEFAASASAKLAALSSEETRVSEVHSSDNPRKIASAYIMTQTKAFSLAASRFFWPTSEKKLMEVPRERCGWCLSCKAGTSKRGCMLNHAALSATKGALKVISGLFPIKNGEGTFLSIAAYMLYMEESLLGLVVGPFLDASYRKHWRRLVEQASTCSSIKFLLLELEKNIRIITFSGDWFKLLDDWALDSSANQNATCTVATATKRGPGRKNRKQSVMSEASDECHDINFFWWRGGKLSKFMLQKAVLPRSMIKRTARLGGSRKISCLSYADSTEIPRRSRQLVWRASVSMSNNASQLALQVRYLDFHLRWGELVRPELIPHDGKGSETEASTFRNAIICDKKDVENKIFYGITFGSQKHLPSRVMKNVIEIDQSQVAMDKYWFSESRVPLYLVKEYEHSLNKMPLPSPLQPSKPLTKSRRHWLKSFRKDIFFYLRSRRDNKGLCACSSCQTDIMIGNAMQCSKCKGYCHEHCVVNSMTSAIREVGFIVTCRRCSYPKICIKNGNITKSPTSPLLLQRQASHSLVSASKGVTPKSNSSHSLVSASKGVTPKSNSSHSLVSASKGVTPKSNSSHSLVSASKGVTPKSNGQSASVKTQHSLSATKHATSDCSLATKSRQKIRSWGIIWKKKNCEDTGADFRLNYILLKGGSCPRQLEPLCHLCSKPYRSELMYICCETCKNWYHAQALELEESKFVDVVGFKCCKCRRIRSPECPYMDQKDKRQESSKIRVRDKAENLPGDFDSCTISVPGKCEFKNLGSPMEELSGPDNDPLLFSLAKVELITDHATEVDAGLSFASGPMPQKLPVRRHVKHEGDVNDVSESGPLYSVSSTNLESYDPLTATEVSSSPQPEWNTSMDGFEGEMDFNYEDMDFEPQTYFSFKELLAPDDELELGTDALQDGQDNWGEQICADEVDSISNLGGVQIGPNDQLVRNCDICSESDPVPDLSCRICGLSIHCHCSPWGDSVPCEENWSCGQCREWR